MAVNDKRDVTKRYTGGSSLIAVGLSAADHQTASGDPSASGGWVVIGYMQGGQFGPSRDIEEIKDEADFSLGTRVSRDEFEVQNTSFQTDDATLNLLNWLEDNAAPVRYSLPTQALTSVENQWVFLYSAKVRKEDWTVAISQGADRVRQFTLFGSDDGSGNIEAIVTLPANQNDAQWTPYATFKDSVFP